MVITGWVRRPVTSLLAAVVASGALLAGAASPASASAPGQWWADELDLAALHAITRGEGATIGIVDTGIDVTHPDLAGADIVGKDRWSPGKDGFTDDFGHGTGMASLLVGQGKQGGVLGVAPDARLLVYAAEWNYDPFHTGYFDDDLGAGIAWLVEQRVDVILLAYGNSNPPKRPEGSGLRAAERVGIPVIAAAGNSETAQWPDEVEWPAATPGVVAVSGTKPGGKFSPASSVTGKEVAVAAPAEDVGFAIPGDLPGFGGALYTKGSGTSGASAITAGVMALLAARFPAESREQLIHRLTSTSTDRGPAGHDKKYGHGVIDPLAALAEGVDLSGAAPAPITRAPLPAWSPGAMPTDPVVVSVWTRWDIWAACGLALVAGLVLVIAGWRRPRRQRLVALGVAAAVIGAAAGGTAVTVARAADPPVTAIAWPEFTAAPPAGERVYTDVCQQASDEAGLWLDLYMRPSYWHLEGEMCEIAFPRSSDPGGSPQSYLERVAIRITWGKLAVNEIRDADAEGPLHCREGAAVWTVAGVPTCTDETADPTYTTYSYTRFMLRQSWVTIEVLQDIETDKPDYHHSLLTLLIPIVVTGSRAATDVAS
ncbi:S8 family serine peptidase [Phytomonospora sp. NPDC050363]|uniref:S8 family serine peptidase n=1 Tax=Phytomonospora sp. NPDC050363 TaxID=3155642 RepID=UPI0033F81074